MVYASVFRSGFLGTLGLSESMPGAPQNADKNLGIRFFYVVVIVIAFYDNIKA